MMRLRLRQPFLSFSTNSNSNNKNENPLSSRADSQEILNNVKDMIYNQRKHRQNLANQEININMPAISTNKFITDHQVNVTLFMRHDCWKSQYIHALLNYHHIGFIRVSDLTFLDRASYFLKLREISDEQRWPSVKVLIGLNPRIILTGMKDINEFFGQNLYFQKVVESNTSEIQALEQHIQTQFIPYLESLFWHPKLTFQYTFHTNISSYRDASRNNFIVDIIRRNGWLLAKRIANNLLAICKQYPRYTQSKEKVYTILKELESQYLVRNNFFGGEKPNHIDFYLFSLIETKSSSSLFTKFLQNTVKGEILRWIVRMKSLCQYNPERVTLL